MTAFCHRVAQLPVLGLGISTEYGAANTPEALDTLALHEAYPAYAAFLEIGIEAGRGIDESARQWVERGLPTTYHFLDVNLDESEDFDPPWMTAVAEIAAHIQPAWMCGDAGLWHFGRRERGHMLLLPPILSADAARGQVEGIVRLREQLGYEVFPENPPGHAYIGPMHLLEFYANVVEQADTGMLLDCAHLAMYQQYMGYAPCTGLEAFPLDRIVELHVAGSAPKEHQGFVYWDDAHTPEVLSATWQIFEWVVSRTPHLKAVVFECERNTLDSVLPVFQRIAALLAETTLTARGAHQ